MRACARSSTLLRDAQNGAARAWIGADFGIAGELRLADRDQRRWHGFRRRRPAPRAAHDFATNEVLDRAIFERMKTDHDQAPRRLQTRERTVEATLQRAEFVVDVDAQRLERARRGM